MTIGASDTADKLPTLPVWVSGYAKGVDTGLTVSTKARGLSFISDSFDSTDDWINVHGRLGISGGNVYTTSLNYSAGRHKTQLLSDNCRAKVTIQGGTVLYGESRVVICADERFNRYYGIAIDKNALSAKVSIIRGLSSIRAVKYETTTTTIAAGDEFEVWYDRINSTVRIYRNGSELASKYFEPNDIPHGPGCRWTGIVMGTNWLLDIGPNFGAFEAFDVTEPNPKVYDPVDSLTVNLSWVATNNTVSVKRHRFQPLSLGPASTTTAAVRWTSEMDTNSVKAVFTAYRLGSGKFAVALRSNSAMTNWIGIQFDTANNLAYAVTGSGPVTVTSRGTPATAVTVSTGQQYTVTYDDSTETIRLYKGASRTPLVSWAAGANFTASGKYVGLVWNRGTGPAIEPSVFEAYNVDANAPLL